MQARAAGPRVELERRRLLPDGAVGADGVDDGGCVSQVGPGGNGKPGRRPAEIAQLHAVAACRLGQLGIVGEERVHAGLDVEPGPMHALRMSRQTGGNVPPVGATPTSAVVGP